MRKKKETEKGLLHKIRKRVEDLYLRTNNIDRLMREKIEDYILIEEQPLGIQIGEKTIYIGNFTIENDFKFWQSYGKLLAHVGLKFVNFDLLNEGVELFKILHTNKKFYKGICKLIKEHVLKQQGYFYVANKQDRKLTKWSNCSYRYFMKHITYEKLMQMCMLIYKFNYDAEKKNWTVLLGRLGQAGKQASQTYIYSWLQNAAGLYGTFHNAQLINVDYWYKESMKEEQPLTKQGLKKQSKVNKNEKIGANT